MLRNRAGQQPQLAAANPVRHDRRHILFGTDWPAAPEPTVTRNIDNLVAFDGFTSDQLAAVERANAARLFRRPALPPPGN